MTPLQKEFPASMLVIRPLHSVSILGVQRHGRMAGGLAHLREEEVLGRGVVLPTAMRR